MRNAALVMVVAALMAIGAAPPPASRAIKVGEPLPNVELTLLDGTKVNTADLRGQVVILNFWATWCVPCRTELPLLDA